MAIIPKIDPEILARTYRNPLALSGLLVDLAPIYGVLVLGWGAAPLVMLYWLENVMIGIITLGRLLFAGVRGGAATFAGALFMGAFFTVHYGMFCFVHGVFLRLLPSIADGSVNADFPDPLGLISYSLGLAPGIPIIAAALFAWRIVTSVDEAVGTHGDRPEDIATIMGSPYGRIIVLHIGIFAGFGAMIALGEPMIGVLALILLDVAWGIIQAVRRESNQTEPQPQS